MGRFADLAHDLNNALDTLVEKLVVIANNELDIADENAYREYGPIEKAKIKEIFDQAVDEFYDSYSPQYYDRNRSLYNILDIQEDEYGMAATEAAGYTDLFNEDNMTKVTKARDGSSLYDLVFMQGWHGGATGTDRNGMSVSSPHYRTPYPGDSSLKKGYIRWGRQAARSTAPAKVFSRRYEAADSGELQQIFDSLVDKHWALAEERITEQQMELERELFG